jgi:hypothetical protein
VIPVPNSTLRDVTIRYETVVTALVDCDEDRDLIWCNDGSDDGPVSTQRVVGSPVSIDLVFNS